MKELYRLQKSMVQASNIKRSSLPIIQSVFVRPDWTGLHGTNLDCSFDVFCGTQSSKHALLNAVDALNCQGSAFTVDGNSAKFDSGAVLPCGNKEEYPNNRAPGKVLLEAEMPWQVFRDAFAFVYPALSLDLTRPSLCGVLMDGKRLAATDSHRLHTYPLSLPDKCNVILDPTLCAMLMRLPDKPGTINIKVQEYGVRVVVTFESGITAAFLARTIDGPYPAIDQVIPKLTDKHIEVDADILTGLLKTAKGHWSKVTSGVVFQLGGTTLSAACKREDTSFETTVPAAGDFLDRWSVKGSYLTTIAKLYKAELLTIKFQPQHPDSSAITIRGNGSGLVILMPLRLED